MTYFSKNAELKNGYNAYIDTAVDDMGTQMDIGLLLMEDGDTYTIEEPEKETAVLLFAGCKTRWMRRMYIRTRFSACASRKLR